MGHNCSTRTDHVPRVTTTGQIDGTNIRAVGLKTVGLPEEAENYLLNCVLQLEEKLFGLPTKDLWLLAY
jgi:hypothetical protein